MIRRAFFFSLLALLAGLVGWSGWLGARQAWAWDVCYAALAWAGLSLVFSLFEEVDIEDEPRSLKRSLSQDSH